MTNQHPARGFLLNEFQGFACGGVRIRKEIKETAGFGKFFSKARHQIRSPALITDSVAARDAGALARTIAGADGLADMVNKSVSTRIHGVLFKPELRNVLDPILVMGRIASIGYQDKYEYQLRNRASPANHEDTRRMMASRQMGDQVTW